MREVEGKRDRCLLVAELCRARSSLGARSPTSLAREQEALFVLIEAVAGEEASSVADSVAPVDRMGRLAEVLKQHFPQDHAVWGYVRWVWPGAA